MMELHTSAGEEEEDEDEDDKPSSLDECLEKKEKVTVFGDTFFYCFSGDYTVQCSNTSSNCLPKPSGYFSSVYRVGSSEDISGM